MVSIDEQEQILTTVSQQCNTNVSNENMQMLDNEQQIDISIQSNKKYIECFFHRLILSLKRVLMNTLKLRLNVDRVELILELKTTSSLDPSTCRRFQTVEQQTTPIVTRLSSSSSCQTIPIAIAIRQTKPTIETSSKMITEGEEYQKQQVTPMHAKALIHLRRNVRFQFTPSTDARSAAKEKLEEEQRQIKKQILIDNPKEIQSDNGHEEDTEDKMKLVKKN